MSETDSFIQEVTEEVRQDRMFALWKKWGPLVIGVVVLAIGATAFWQWQEFQEQAAAEARGGTFIAADPERIDQMTALPERVDGPAQLVARLAAAAAMVDAGQDAEALAAYRAIAGEAGVLPEYADLATLQAARLTAKTGDADAARAALEPLTGTGRPYRLLALELRAALALQAGETAEAHADLRLVVADPSATSSQRQRALAMLQVSGGTPGDEG